MAVNFVEVVARRKLGMSDDWLMHGWESVGDTHDLIVRGGVPVGVFKSGPRKGRPKWEGKGEMCVVTDREERDEKAKYETETGQCAECQGAARKWAGWSHDTGNRYRPCKRCNATGKAPEPQA